MKNVYRGPGYFRMLLNEQGGEPSVTFGYGLLYNWYAATDARGVTPVGWRVPTQDDFTQLFNELGTSAVRAPKMKSTRTEPDADPSWESPNTGATGESGLEFYPAGYRTNTGGYDVAVSDPSFKRRAYIRFLTPSNINNTRAYSLSYNSTSVGALLAGNEADKSFAFSIRCVRDTAPPSPTVTDADGNLYTWVQIGSQYWLAQNLKTTKYNNSDPITTGLDNAAWAATTEGAWAYPNGDSNLPI